MKYAEYIIAPIVVMFALSIIVIINKWINEGYQRWPEPVRWIAFLPISLTNGLLIGMVMMLSSVYIFALNETFSTMIQMIAAPLLIIYSINIAIPRAKKTFSIIFGALWIIGSILEVMSNGEDSLIRIVQVIAIVIMLFYIVQKGPT